MNDQTRAAATASVAAARSEDAWDRLAALAFGGASSPGGRSEHAHEYDCACLALMPLGPDPERAADPLPGETRPPSQPDTEFAD